MQTTVNLPAALYEKSESLAASRGAMIEQFIVEAVAKEVQGAQPNCEVESARNPIGAAWIPRPVSHHRIARQWFSDVRNEKLAICRITQLGFLRLLTNGHVMQKECMSPGGAWQAYRLLRSDWRIGYLPEPAAFSETWNEFTEGKLSSPNLWTDAYLCAFAHADRLNLVTFDAKIPSREGLSCLVLGGSKN